MPTPAIRPIDSQPFSPPDFHNSATPSATANAIIPVTSFIREYF